MLAIHAFMVAIHAFMVAIHAFMHVSHSPGTTHLEHTLERSTVAYANLPDSKVYYPIV